MLVDAVAVVLSGSAGGTIVVAAGALFYRALKDKIEEDLGMAKMKQDLNEALNKAEAAEDQQRVQWARITETIIKPMENITTRLERVADIQEKHGRQIAVLLDRQER